MDTKELEGYLSIRQTADLLGYTREGIRKLILKGELSPIYNIDGFTVIPQKTIDNFEKARKKQSITDNRFKIK